MKNAFLALTLFLVATSTFALQAATESKLRKIAGTEFGKTILEMIAVEFDSKEDPRPTILKLLQDLKDEALAAQSAAIEEHTKTQDNCKSTQDALSAEIAELDQKIADDTADKNAKSAKVEELTGQKEAKQAAIDALNADLNSATEARNANQDLWQKKDDYYSRVLDVLRKVRQFISDRKDTRSATGFLQTSAESLTSALSQIRASATAPEFVQVSAGYSHLVTFLANKIEVSLKQSGDVDAQAVAGLDHILQVIDKLIASFESNRAADNAANEQDKADFEARSTDLSKQIALDQADIAAIDTEITNLNGAIADLEKSIETNTTLRDSDQASLNASHGACDAESDAFAKSFKDRSDQIDILDEVIRIVKEELTGLREFTENVITSGTYS